MTYTAVYFSRPCLLHSSVFDSEKYPKGLSFQSFLHLKEFLKGAFNALGALTSKKHAAEQGVIMLNLSEAP